MTRIMPGKTAFLFAPVVLTFGYPFLLQGFSDHAGASWPAAAFAWLCLLAATAVPLVGLGWAYALRDATEPGIVSARQLAWLTMIAPPLFVFIGVTRGLIGRPLTEQSVWIGVWILALGYTWLKRPHTSSSAPVSPRLRVAHGVSASLILLYIAFHLTNHLSGLIGPELHGAIMKAGRTVYRRPLVEALLVALLLFQIASGLTLARRASRLPGDGFRVLQVGSGVYVASFIVTHLNSALVGARAVRHIETDWAWASGGAEGLIYDAWNIRLVPHYGLGVFFVLTHLLLGLRHVLVAHGVEARLVSRLWWGGIIACAAVAAAIMAGLLGLRI